MSALFGTFAPDRALLVLGTFTVYWYGVCIAAAIAAALLVSQRFIRRRGYRIDIYDAAIWIVPAALIGARLVHVFIFQWAYYADHPDEIIKIWEGGIAIQGALAGGLVALAAYARRKKILLWALMDAVSIALPLGQAIGRWGNFFNQELYGRPTNLPWGLYISEENRIFGFEAFNFFHPTFLYESLLSVALFIFLYFFFKKTSTPGRLTGVYLIGYGVIRFVVDFARIDPMPVSMGLRYSQWLSVVLIGAGVALFFYTKTAHRWRDGGDSNPRPPA